MNSGSLGHGLSVCVGMALAGRMDQRPYRVYTLMGDGELAEGSVWEGAMAAGHYHLDNLCAVVDFNGLQISGPTKQVMSHERLSEQFAAFDWHVISVQDGITSLLSSCTTIEAVMYGDTPIANIESFSSAPPPSILIMDQTELFPRDSDSGAVFTPGTVNAVPIL